MSETQPHGRPPRLLAGALAAVMLLTAGCGFFPREEEEEPPVLAAPVRSEKEVYAVARGDITDQLTLRARFVSESTQDLYYSASGRIKAVHVKSGDQVQAGQLLVELYTEDAEQSLAQTEIRFEKAEMALADARNKAQFNSSQSVLNDIRSKELDLESVRLDLAKQRRQLAESRMVAPFSGQVTVVNVKTGDNIQAYAAVLNLVDPNRLVIEADVDDAALVRIALGQQTRLDFSDLGEGLTGAVVELPPDGATGTRRIKVRPDTALTGARMGMVGRVNVVLQEKKDVLLLPNAAIRLYAGRNYVLTSQPRREVDVELGIQGATVTEIIRGLEEGDQVIGR